MSRRDPQKTTGMSALSETKHAAPRYHRNVGPDHAEIAPMPALQWRDDAGPHMAEVSKFT